MSRLTVTDPSIYQIYELSKKLFKSGEVDDKKDRMLIDVTSAKIIIRNNLEYNRSTKQWEQVAREVKIVSQVSSKPESYVRNDTVPTHKFPVTFLIRSWDRKILSSFRYRSGSERKPTLPGKNETSQSRLNKINQTIRNGVDLHFFFHLMVVLKMNKLLFGRDTTNGRPPKITNPKGYVYFEKHSLFVLEKIIFPIMNNKSLSIGKSVS